MWTGVQGKNLYLRRLIINKYLSWSITQYQGGQLKIERGTGGWIEKKKTKYKRNFTPFQITCTMDPFCVNLIIIFINRQNKLNIFAFKTVVLSSVLHYEPPFKLSTPWIPFCEFNHFFINSQNTLNIFACIKVVLSSILYYDAMCCDICL